MKTDPVSVVGAGRMGRGIAVSYILAKIPVKLVDLKERSSSDFETFIHTAVKEIEQDLQFLVSVDFITQSDLGSMLDLVTFFDSSGVREGLEGSEIIYEAVPEILLLKERALKHIDDSSSKTAIVASTTSTFLVSDLQMFISHPERFLNAHWLNPAHLIPLVEISKNRVTTDQTLEKVRKSLESIGKVTVICASSAGYIVPRIQALAMNEAARIVEEGVATPEDVDKAVKFGFGPRFATLGLLEFIDWGGGDILFYASNYLSKKLGKRFEAPSIIEQNMKDGKDGLRDRMGFFNYENMNLEEYRNRRTKELLALLLDRNLINSRTDKGN